jgi:hypothetical protein
MKHIIFITLLFLSNMVYSQSDLQVTLHENTLNKLFSAIGEFNGSGEYEMLFTKNTYTWNLKNMRINLMKDSAEFVTDATVVTWLGTYHDQVHGKVAISYDEKTNLISVKVVDAPFNISVEMFGKKVVLKKIQIADYLTTPFQFEGPMSIQNQLSFSMPDGSVKKIAAKPSKCIIRVLQDKIEVSTQIEFK